MGYIIVWKNPDVRLKDGTISSGKKILIDGQQRITALQAAIVGEPVIGSNYRKKRIKIAFHPLEQRFEVANPAIEKDGAWIPDIAPLYQPGFDSFNFVIDYCIKNQLDIAQVTEIFIRINSKGVVLSQACHVQNLFGRPLWRQSYPQNHGLFLPSDAEARRF